MRLQRLTWVVTASVVVVAFACMEPASSPRPTAPLRDAASGPQLLACSADTTQQGPVTVIGPDGGTLAFGDATVSIPANAVAQATPFQIVVPATAEVKAEIHAVGLSTYLFQQPVQVTLDYSRCATDQVPAGATLEGVYVDSTNTVLQEMGGTVDTVNRTVTFTTGHLSGYAVAY